MSDWVTRQGSALAYVTPWLDQVVTQANLCFKVVGVGLPDIMESWLGAAGFPKSMVNVFLSSIVLASTNH